MVKNILSLFNTKTHEKANQLLEKAIQQHEEIKLLKAKYISLKGWYEDFYITLNSLSNDMGAMIWRKDKNHRYVVLNSNHCFDFFGIDNTPECLNMVKGKTDDELIKNLYYDHGFYNSFSKICLLSDNYTVEQGEQCHFLEAGFIDDEQVLLYIIKTPQYKDGELIATNGIAWDFTHYANDIISMLNRWIYDDKVNTLYCNDNVFCHALNPDIKQCDIFYHICPFPEDRAQCDSCKK